MVDLGNEIVNTIYEATFNIKPAMDGNSATYEIQKASHNSDNNVREAWIKAKYVEKLFVFPLSVLKCITNENGNNFKKLIGISFTNEGWSVKRLRRKRTKLDFNIVEHKLTEDNASNKESSESDNLNQISDFSFNSDQDSTDGEDSDPCFDVNEESTELNSDILLYKASSAHNLPVMCYALALGASKNWINQLDLKRVSLHKAVLSVSLST